MSRFQSFLPVVLGVVAACAAPAFSLPLYGVSFTSAQGSVFYEINPLSGQALLSAPTGLDHIIGISVGPGGRLYGLTNATAPTQANSLVRIEPATGVAEVLGPTGLDNIVEGDLTYDRTSGLLYGMYQLVGGERKLFTLNAATGAATTLPVSLSGDPSGMAFDATGMLYLIDDALTRILTVNKTTGEVLTTRSLNRTLGSVAGMAMNPLSGIFYVVDGDSGGTNCLFTLNPALGTLTFVGTTVSGGLGGLTFLPEPATLLLAAIALAMPGGRRRRSI